MHSLWKAIYIFGEYFFGVLVLIIDLFAILVGLVISLFELPRHLRNMFM